LFTNFKKVLHLSSSPQLWALLSKLKQETRLCITNYTRHI
jgi:hypothetical protein